MKKVRENIELKHLMTNRRFNELIALSSFYMNEIVLLKPDEDLATYQTTDRYRVISVDENYKRLNLK